MLDELKKQVYEQNLALVQYGLVVLTWGNVSGIDRERGLVVIKPSGVPYADMVPSDLVVVDLEGNIIEGSLRPSSDTPTHLELYKAFPGIGGVVHTHSTYAVAFAQTGRAIKAYGTTHADAFYGDIPCTRALTREEIEKDYEQNTGKVIIETVKDYNALPAILVKNHGPFIWGKTANDAVENAVILEEVARMAMLTEQLDPSTPRVEQYLLDKHFFRKHGKGAYYGQGKKK